MKVARCMIEIGICQFEQMNVVKSLALKCHRSTSVCAEALPNIVLCLLVEQIF